MTDTQALIAALAARAEPVRPLRGPLWRGLVWLAIAAPIIATMAFLHGLRPDLLEQGAAPLFTLTGLFALLTGLTATFAAFATAMPDRSGAWAWLPLPPMLAWVSTIGYGCLTDWVALDAGAIEAGATLRCLAALVLGAIPLSLSMFWMLRRAAPLRPLAPILTGGLAVGALCASALALIRTGDATVLVLLWNLGTALAVLAADAVLGRRMLADERVHLP